MKWHIRMISTVFLSLEWTNGLSMPTLPPLPTTPSLEQRQKKLDEFLERTRTGQLAKQFIEALPLMGERMGAGALDRIRSIEYTFCDKKPRPETRRLLQEGKTAFARDAVQQQIDILEISNPDFARQLSAAPIDSLAREVASLQSNQAQLVQRNNGETFIDVLQKNGIPVPIPSEQQLQNIKERLEPGYREKKQEEGKKKFLNNMLSGLMRQFLPQISAAARSAARPGRAIPAQARSQLQQLEALQHHQRQAQLIARARLQQDAIVAARRQTQLLNGIQRQNTQVFNTLTNFADVPPLPPAKSQPLEKETQPERESIGDGGKPRLAASLDPSTSINSQFARLVNAMQAKTSTPPPHPFSNVQQALSGLPPTLNTDRLRTRVSSDTPMGHSMRRPTLPRDRRRPNLHRPLRSRNYDQRLALHDSDKSAGGIRKPKLMRRTPLGEILHLPDDTDSRHTRLRLRGSDSSSNQLYNTRLAVPTSLRPLSNRAGSLTGIGAGAGGSTRQKWAGDLQLPNGGNWLSGGTLGGRLRTRCQSRTL